MENNEDLNGNKNNFPINRIEQKETKNIYPSGKINNKKENLINKEKEIDKEEQNENIEIKQETAKENIEEIKNENEIENNEDNKHEEEKEEKTEEKNHEEEKKEEEKEEKKEEENVKETEEVNKIFNNSDLGDTSLNKDNDVAKELKIKFNKIIKDEFEFPDKLPLIKSGSYLTELPLDSSNKKSADTVRKNNYKESSRVIKYLKEKELSLNKEILNVKDKKDKLINISYNNLGFSDIEKTKIISRKKSYKLSKII